MKFRVRRTDGRDALLHSTSEWTQRRSTNQRSNFDHTFFKDTPVIVHHGVKGMKWGVHNEETQQKYGETGAGLAGGGGAVSEDDEDVNSDESRKKENQGILSPDQIQQMKEFEERTDGAGIWQEDKTDFFGNKTGEKKYYYKNKYDHKAYPLDEKTVKDGKFNSEVSIVEDRRGDRRWDEGKDDWVYDYETVEVDKTKKRG